LLGVAIMVGLWVASRLPADSGLWWGIVLEIQSAQRALHRELAIMLQNVKDNGAAATWWLVTLSFLYGVLHAAGPGHGKIIITTYLLTQPSRLARGIWLSLLTSLFQGITAVVSVGIVVALLDLSLRQAHSTADDLELLSYILVALAGLALTFINVRRIAKRALNSRSRETKSDDKHPALSDACCDHSHGPTPNDLDAPMSWRSMVAMTVAIGVRPCSGAILVLLVAWSANTLDRRRCGTRDVSRYCDHSLDTRDALRVREDTC
jgi:nickel/cobalt exporter